MYGIREYSNFIDLHAAVQLSQHHWLKRLSFLHCVFLPPLSKIDCVLKYPLIFFLSVLYLTHWLLRSVLLNSHLFVNFPLVLLY